MSINAPVNSDEENTKQEDNQTGKTQPALIVFIWFLLMVTSFFFWKIDQRDRRVNSARVERLQVAVVRVVDGDTLSLADIAPFQDIKSEEDFVKVRARLAIERPDLLLPSRLSEIMQFINVRYEPPLSAPVEAL